MKKTDWMTDEQINDMNEMFENQLSISEIVELTGRSEPTIRKRRKLWEAGRKAERSVENENEPEPKQENTENKLANSDYAKAYLSGDPAVIRTSFDIERTIRIKSKKTGILYELDTDSKDRVIKITMTDGTELKIELSTFEKFVDEGVDVYLEMTKTA